MAAHMIALEKSVGCAMRTKINSLHIFAVRAAHPTMAPE